MGNVAVAQLPRLWNRRVSRRGRRSNQGAGRTSGRNRVFLRLGERLRSFSQASASSRHSSTCHPGLRLQLKAHDSPGGGQRPSGPCTHQAHRARRFRTLAQAKASPRAAPRMRSVLRYRLFQSSSCTRSSIVMLSAAGISESTPTRNVFCIQAPRSILPAIDSISRARTAVVRNSAEVSIEPFTP